MPAKMAPRTRKPARRAVTRKPLAAKKSARSAKPAARKARVTGVRASKRQVARTTTIKSRKPAPAAARPVAKALARGVAQKIAKPTNPAGSARLAASARQTAVMSPRAPAPALHAAEVRPMPSTGLSRLARRPPAPVDEEDEPTGTHSLLLGPRNVRPYHERKGEQYMGKDQLEHFRTILNSWKRDLMEEVDRTMTHMKDEAANPPDPNDRATLESEFALELRTRDRERKLIRKIEEALNRIDDGSYGYCNETGEPIGVKRLEARPVATLCIEAQERRERREKQYGDRDDWYR